MKNKLIVLMVSLIGTASIYLFSFTDYCYEICEGSPETCFALNILIIFFVILLITALLLALKELWDL